MNVFVLCTGRCGSTTVVRACTHIANFTSAHESRIGLVGRDRFNYPPNHIEADNRLSWLLGRLDAHYGDDAFYVHLKRDVCETAASFVKRWDVGIMQAYRRGILLGLPADADRLAVALDYCHTVNSNIEAFLKDKSRKMEFLLERADHDFPIFCDRIGADARLETAIAEFAVRHNASAAS